MFKILTYTKPYIGHYKKIGKIFKGFSSKSFVTESNPKKPFISKVVDYLFIFFNMKIMPENYHIFGFEGKKRCDFKRYLGETWNEPFMRKIWKIWGNGILLRDKMTFKIICEYHSLPVPKNFGLLRKGQFEGGQEKVLMLIEQQKPKMLVMKPVVGQNGVGIQFITPDQVKSVCNDSELHKETYVIEEAVEQHPELNKINPHSVNTIRLITFLCPDGKVELLSGMLKTSATKIPIDNFNLGGIAIGIDLASGRLNKKGYSKFYSPDSVIDNRKSTDPATIKKILYEISEMQARHPGRTFDRHPLTGFRFEGFQLPGWDSVVEAAIKGQRVFYHGKSIAWDIAITTNGPVILEGNEGWGTSAIQATNGGLLSEKTKTLFAQYGLYFYGDRPVAARPAAHK
jgi:hypothetical protein